MAGPGALRGSPPPWWRRAPTVVAVAVVGLTVLIAVAVARPPATAPDASPSIAPGSGSLGPAAAMPVPEGCDGEVTRVSGRQDQPYRDVDLAAREVLDARDATWTGADGSGRPIDWTITLDGDGGGCWLGGRWRGAWDDTDPAITWEDPYHHAGLVTLRLPDFTIAGIAGSNHGDGIRMDRGADGFNVVGVHLADIHDDCVENDYMLAGTVRDSFLDGCYVGFSAASHSGNDDSGDGNVWEIRANLVRMEAQPTTYSGPTPGHGQVFKWDGDGPVVDLVDNVFRVDRPANHGTVGLPDALRLGKCSGNVVVWGGEGPYPDPLPDCFSVTTDLGVWDRAVASWQRRHSTTT